jgi:hypothetical protein
MGRALSGCQQREQGSIGTLVACRGERRDRASHRQGTLCGVEVRATVGLAAGMRSK